MTTKRKPAETVAAETFTFSFDPEAVDAVIRKAVKPWAHKRVLSVADRVRMYRAIFALGMIAGAYGEGYKRKRK